MYFREVQNPLRVEEIWEHRTLSGSNIIQLQQVFVTCHWNRCGRNNSQKQEAGHCKHLPQEQKLLFCYVSWWSHVMKVDTGTLIRLWASKRHPYSVAHQQKQTALSNGIHQTKREIFVTWQREGLRVTRILTLQNIKGCRAHSPFVLHSFLYENRFNV